MKYFLLVTSLLAGSFVQAEVISLSMTADRPSSVLEKVTRAPGGQSSQHLMFNLNKVHAELHPTNTRYHVFTEKGINFAQTVGEAAIPFTTKIVIGNLEDITVSITKNEVVEVPVVAAPAQPEDCRCTTKKRQWVEPSRANQQELVKLEYLGKQRGVPLTRVIIKAAATDYSKGITRFYPRLEAHILSRDLTVAEQMEPESYEYLIVSPSSLVEGLTDFATFKTEQGLKVKVVELESIGKDVAKLTTFFKEEYVKNKYRYSLIVGTDDLVPNHRVVTSGSSSTLSDYPYYLMDDSDMIPDVHFGRLVASTTAQVETQTSKWINYQRRDYDSTQFLRMIGIASNEGSNPSDNDYVLEIEEDMNAAFGTVASHFYENDVNSNPEMINSAFNAGTSLLVYLGHGSGTGWSSTGTRYSTEDAALIDNAGILQPLLIDVACQNGTLKNGYLGETFMNAQNAAGEGVGTSMYYGGSVDISWHPPAIMAKGMVKRAIGENLTNVGDILLSGHKYLLENYTDIEAIRDNFEWYHLFGDPSSSVNFK